MPRSKHDGPPSTTRVALSALFIVVLTAGSSYLLLTGSGERVERLALWLIAVSGAAFLGLGVVAFLAATVFRRRQE